MSAWLSMIPVEGECSAPMQKSSGSRRATSSLAIQSMSVTPLACAFSRSAASSGSWFSFVATISLPQRRCGTPCDAQYS